MRKRLVNILVLVGMIIPVQAISSSADEEGMRTPEVQSEDEEKIGTNKYAVDESRENADEALILNRRKEFFEHIAGARNIRVAKSATAFNWDINWPAQQKYCRKLSAEIFAKKDITFPEPIFRSTRGTTRQLKEILDAAVAPRRCGNLVSWAAYSFSPSAPDVVIGTNINTRGWDGYTFRVYSERMRDRANIYVELLKPDATDQIDPHGVDGPVPDSKIRVNGFSIYQDKNDGGNPASERSPARGCYGDDPFEALGYPSDRSVLQKVLLARVGGRMMALEFGTYSRERFPGFHDMNIHKSIGDVSSLNGRAGEGYVLVKEVEKEFSRYWSVISAGETFGGYEQPIDLQSMEDGYAYSCIFNFRKSERK
ncbi:hypothetical protein [Herbaspirillum camelliae]|uniref:hypothetical protein n=1 Tax=Herbaspirillum camelliae TaxID=1892903 RepID=UPI000949E1B3|nr:hypothetical protein [Herbaspirillum camelliae]